MSSDEEISDIESGDDVVFPGNDSSEEDNDLEEVDRIDDDALVDDDVTEIDEFDVMDDVIVSEVRDRNHKKIIIVHDDDRQTSNIIQRPEMTEAIGIRASQIERGSPVFTDVTGYTDPILMAKKEFVDRANPLIVERALRDSPTEALVEQWKVREMTFPITSRESMTIATDQQGKAGKTGKTGKAGKTGKGEGREGHDDDLETEFRYL